MKKIVTLLLILVCVVSVFSLSSCGEDAKDTVVLNVYNWGQYISDGSEDSFDVNSEFEAYFNENLSDKYGFNVKVNYTTYASNEDMYNKIKSGAVTYDIIIPSEYMIERMIDENLLLELNYDNIPNYENIYDKYKNLPHDPENKYSVPYNVGMVGIIYNTTMVDEEDVTGSWDLLWNEKYAGKILQFNNPRDAIGTAMYYLGIDVNTQDKSKWDESIQLLKDQKPLIQSYVMDEIFNKMKNGSAAIAPYYAGDFLTMYEDNEYLDFYYPEEGTNIFVDAMCIPSCAAHKDIAEEYINFMLTEEVAVANAEYIYYASPNKLVCENEEYVECMEDVYEGAIELLYPDEDKYKTQYYESLSPEMLRYEDEIWESLKIENEIELWVHISAGIIVFGIIGFLIGKGAVKKKRESKY